MGLEMGAASALKKEGKLKKKWHLGFKFFQNILKSEKKIAKTVEKTKIFHQNTIDSRFQQNLRQIQRLPAAPA